MSLSEFTIRKAKPKDKAYRLTDGDGLNLLIRPNGSKLWQLRYRFQNKENILSFGKYPIVTLADARRKRDDAKKLLVEGQDPSARRKLDKIAADTAARQTFGLIADEYIENMSANGAAKATITKTTWLLKDLAAPLTKRPIKDIHPAEILDLLKRVEKSGRRETARRLRGTISSVFKLAIVTLRADTNPTVPLHGALLTPKTTGRAAITDERKFGILLCDIDGYDGWPTITAALKLLILTCVRPGEVRGAVRSEFDLKKAVWSIPAERMKMRQRHDVPLSKQALAVLKDVWPLSEGGDLVFPSIRSIHRPLSENAFNSALRRMGYTKEEVTAHGFRATVSTILNSRGYDPDVVEAVLAHQDNNSVRRAYNRATYWEKRVLLMQKWADLLNNFRKHSGRQI
ncbi:MAG: integrase arm-type DNA-binding domain-containing protein [Anderseniella sp.]